MAIRQVDTELWNDMKVTDDFTPEDKYFWLFLLTTKYSNLSGVFELSFNQIAKDMGYSVESVEVLINRFENQHNLIRYDFETQEIWIINWYKYNWTKSPKFEIALLKFIENIKSKYFKETVLDIHEKYKKNDMVSIPYGYHSISKPISITNTNTISNTKSNTKTYISKLDNKTNTFDVPKLENIKKYVEENKFTVDPNQFYDFYQSKGWMVGKNKMKDWKASVRTWERQNKVTNLKPKRGVEFEEPAWLDEILDGLGPQS